MLSPYALESIRFPNVRIVTRVSSLGFRMRNAKCMKFSVYFCQHPFSSCLSSFHHSGSSSKLRNVHENKTLPIQHLQRMRPQLKALSIGPFMREQFILKLLGPTMDTQHLFFTLQIKLHGYLFWKHFIQGSTNCLIQEGFQASVMSSFSVMQVVDKHEITWIQLQIIHLSPISVATLTPVLYSQSLL